MKRFEVKSHRGLKPITIKIDDQDAYLMRSMIWYRDGNSSRLVRYAGCGTTLGLAQQLLDLPAEVKVRHLNKDRFDYTRGNLAVAELALA